MNQLSETGREAANQQLRKIIILSKYFDISSDMLLGLKEPLELTENDKELLELFRTLPEREQIKLIGRIEDLVNKYKGD